MKLNWKDPIGAFGSACAELIKLAEQYWIHVGIGIVLLIIIVFYLMLKKGI